MGEAILVRGSASSDPVGTIKSTVRTDLGDKWLLCNGAEIDATEYPALAGITKINAFSTYKEINLPAAYADINFTATGARKINGTYFILATYVDNVLTKPVVIYSTDPTAQWSVKELPLPYGSSTRASCTAYDIGYDVTRNEYVVVGGGTSTNNGGTAPAKWTGATIDSLEMITTLAYVNAYSNWYNGCLSTDDGVYIFYTSYYGRNIYKHDGTAYGTDVWSTTSTYYSYLGNGIIDNKPCFLIKYGYSGTYYLDVLTSETGEANTWASYRMTILNTGRDIAGAFIANNFLYAFQIQNSSSLIYHIYQIDVKQRIVIKNYVLPEISVSSPEGNDDYIAFGSSYVSDVRTPADVMLVNTDIDYGDTAVGTWTFKVQFLAGEIGVANCALGQNSDRTKILISIRRDVPTISINNAYVYIKAKE